MDKKGRLFFFSSRRRHTRSLCDWSSDVCSSDLWPAGAPCLTTTPCVCPAGGGGGGCGVGVGRPMRMTCRPEFVSAACHAAVAGAPPGSAGGRTASRTSARVITSRFIAPSFPVSPDNSGPDRGFGHLREVNLVVLAAGRREDEGARGGQA